MPTEFYGDKSFQSVLGVDVGYSETRISTGICLLSWDETEISLKIGACRSNLCDQKQALRSFVNGHPLAAVAIDGPLTHKLELVGYYRSAEALLSRGCLQRRGKPGQTSSPVGQRLHHRATELAMFIVDCFRVQESSHYQPIHAKSIVEAFPNIFLAALIPEMRLPPLQRDASDRYWEVAVEDGIFIQLMESLLPKRVLLNDLVQVTNHDERAAIVCAFTALVIATDQPVGVGDSSGGDIILPPSRSWGEACNSSKSWILEALRENIESVRANRGIHPHHDSARIYEKTSEWKVDNV